MELPAGGEHSYVLPQAPRPELPGAEEMFHAQASTAGPLAEAQVVVASGADPRFDQALMHLLRQVQSHPGLVVPLAALSRLSRNSAKQLRVLEFLLAHQATIVTTNCLLGPGVVGVRARPMAKPDSYDLRRSMKPTRGLGPTHTKLLKTLKRDHF
ncbi:recombinase family protein [Streptomyces sp. NPDC005506]|uniref:recombinase family protein n=1 Tax=unclassified Streptomyces TaxID=2593676 RepID=UPI0036AC9609